MSSRHLVPPRDRHDLAPLNIAIVGSGISGMAAAWLLSRRHRVTVFEKDGRLGGHSNTVLVQVGGRTIPVDTGFIVYNTAELSEPGRLVRPPASADQAQRACRSRCRSIDGALEYSGGNGSSTACSGSGATWCGRASGPWSSDILRFYREAPRDLSLGRLEGVTLGDYLTAAGYSRGLSSRTICCRWRRRSGPRRWRAMRDHSGGVDRALLRQSRPAAAAATGRAWRTVDGGIARVCASA